MGCVCVDARMCACACGRERADAPAARRLPEAVLPELARLLLVLARGVGPDTLAGHLPQVLVLVVVRRVDPRYGRDLLNHLQPGRTLGRIREWPRHTACGHGGVRVWASGVMEGRGESGTWRWQRNNNNNNMK